MQENVLQEVPNIFLGRCAGLTNTSGSDNIAIGKDVSELHLQVMHNLHSVVEITVGLLVIVLIMLQLLVYHQGIYGSGGIFCATKFCGDGSCLTGINAIVHADKNLLAGTSAGSCLDGSSGCFNIFLVNGAGRFVTSGTTIFNLCFYWDYYWKL